MNKLIWIFLGLVLIIGGVIIYLSMTNGNLFGQGAEAEIANQHISLIVADTPEKRAAGLSNTKKLNKDKGMIFIFDNKAYPSFWMKDMNFPIDIIFLDNDKVVTIHENVQPPQGKDSPLPLYQPTAPSNFVIEVSAGFSKENNLKVDDKIKLSL